MSGRFSAGATAVLMVVFAVALGVFVLSPNPSPEVPETAQTQTARTAFDQGMIEPGPYDASYSRNGALLAVLSDRGVSLAREGKQVTFLKSTGNDASRIVDFTWMPGSESVMVIEGPNTATRLTVVGIDGNVLAAVTLAPSFSAGTGNGLAVDNSNRRAVAVSETRDAIGGARHLDLTVVDLQSGVASPLTSTPDVTETTPFFLDDDHLLYTREQGDRMEAVVMDMTTGTVTRISPEGRRAFAVGTIRNGTWAVYQVAGSEAGAASEVEAVELGTTKAFELGTVVAGANVIAIHPGGAEAVVRAPLGAGDVANRLRAQQLRPPPATE